MTRSRRWAPVPALLCAGALLVAALAGAGSLEAQHVAGTLTLADALRLAREHNPGFQKLRNDLDVASSGVRAAWANAFLPNLTSTLTFSGTRNTTVTGVDPFGQVVRLPEAATSRGSTASQGLNTQLTLFDGLASFRNLSAQRAAYDGAEANIAAQELQLVAQVSREYYQAVRAVRLIALEESLLAAAQERLSTTEALLRIAARNRVDVLGARADVADHEQDLERARGDADKARLTLAATLGLDPTTSLTPDTALPPIFDPADLDAGALVARARAANPLLRQREAALSGARHRAAAARGRRLPTITANGGYNRSVNERGYGAFGEINPLNYGFNFGMTVTLPVFTRFQTSHQIEDAVTAVADAEHDLRATELTVERDVRAALIDLVNTYRSLQLAEQRAALSRERQELTQEQYRLGGLNFTDLQNVIDRTAEAERRALDARFNFINARLNLEEKLGAPLEG